MDALPRNKPVELSREQIDSKTVQAQYKAGYSVISVKSKFIGNRPLDDLFFNIIRKKREAYCHEQHDT